jgi:2-hydroxy-6-oxonona-2,4-dienedioate hydrolase
MTRTENRPVTFQKCADWIAGVVAEWNIGPVHLVGNSYGGEFCWRAAVDHPALFRTLTLLDSGGYARPADGWLPEEVAMREMWLAPIGWAVLDREKMRGAVDIHFPAPVSDDRIEEYYSVSVNSSNWKAMVDLARDENGTREQDIAKLSMPVHLLWGEDDIAYPVKRDAERFAKDVKGAELDVVPNCGHYPQETYPALVAAKLVGFFRRHP